MGSTAQCATSKAWNKIASIQEFRLAWIVAVDDHTLSMTGPVLPIFSGIFRAKNKNDLIEKWVIGNHATMCASFGPIERFDSASRHMNALDGLTIEHRSIQRVPSIVGQPS